MKINDKLQSQILPILNTQVAETIRTQREAFTGQLQGFLSILEEIEENLEESSPIEVEIALDQMGEGLKGVMDSFQSEMSTICGKDGALSLVRKIRGESEEEAQMRKDHRDAKLAARTEAHQQRLAERAERVAAKAAKAEKKEESKSTLEELRLSAPVKKTAKKTTRRSK
tara:strand:+ start:485 stop:994 length:510 start_codon:yes stop_codon:yes gene_type:complete